jgi:hypothetical protein
VVPQHASIRVKRISLNIILARCFYYKIFHPRRAIAARVSYIIQTNILQSASVTARQLHNFRLQSLLCCIPTDRLAASSCGRFVIGTDPTGHTLIRHFASNIAIDSCNKLVMKMFSLPRRGDEEPVDLY